LFRGPHYTSPNSVNLPLINLVLRCSCLSATLSFEHSRRTSPAEGEFDEGSLESMSDVYRCWRRLGTRTKTKNKNMVLASLDSLARFTWPPTTAEPTNRISLYRFSRCLPPHFRPLVLPLLVLTLWTESIEARVKISFDISSLSKDATAKSTRERSVSVARQSILQIPMHLSCFIGKYIQRPSHPLVCRGFTHSSA
jgi:hypothetical protein